MNIAFITNEGFPSGMSTTNRILSLVKGLELQKGVSIKVYCVRPTERRDNQINKEWKGQLTENISFLYTNKSLFWPKQKYKKLIALLIGNIFFIYFFLKDHEKLKFDFIINTTTSFLGGFIYKFIAKILQIKILLTVDEFPIVVRNPKEHKRLYKYLYLKSFFRNFDGLIVMTKVLCDYYKKLVSRNCRIVHIPMTVEPERFCSNGFVIPKKKYIAYCGNLGRNQKDGVPILIKAFHRIISEFTDISLYIIGDTIDRDKSQLIGIKDLVKELGLENKVVFTGKIHRDKLPELLCGAKILALARPNNIQAQGGFPTKLGEYLATGKPVVVTKVGEIPNYLTDGKNSFLAEPDSIESFAEKLSQALKHNRAKEIGIEGRKIANDVFNYKVQSKNLKLFLEEIS